MLSKLESGEISRKDVSDKAVTFIQKLCDWWLSNSYGIYGGSSNTDDTLVVVDANVSGWSGCIFRITEIENGQSYPLPFSISGLLATHEREIIPNSKSIENFTVIPVRFDGGRWNSVFETSQSSTWRERAAAMLMVHKNRECLSGKVFILSDNKNLVGNWRDTESLTSALSSAFSTYISHVHTAIHVKRSHPLLQWVDNSARNLTVPALAVKRILLDDSEQITKKVRSPDADETSFRGSQSANDLQNISPIHNPDDLSDLLEKGWVTHENNNFFTTEKLPGKVEPHSLLIPADDSAHVLKSIHFDFGHPTVSGMRKILTLWKIWVINFGKIAANIVANCQSCLVSRENYHPERSSIPMPAHPMQMVMGDFLQPEKNTQPGFLLLKDRYSGFLEGRAIEHLDSFEIRQLLLEWITRYGPPSVFMSDNAEAFSAEHMKFVYEKYHIFHRKSPVYEPQSNGAVERSIKAVEEGLRIELTTRPPQEAIHVVVSRLNRTTKVPALPDTSLTPRDVIFKFREQQPFYRPAVSKPEFKHDLNLGQKVLIKLPNAPKLSAQFDSKIYQIHGIVGNHIYTLTDETNTVLKSLFRRDRLKPVPDVGDADDVSSSSDNAPSALSEEGMCR